MNIPPEYTKLPNGTLKILGGQVADYTKPYWGVSNRSTITEQIYNVGEFIGINGKTKAATTLDYCVGTTLLEIGCAPGEVMRQAKERGFKCVGLEPCEEHIDFIANLSGAEVNCSMFEDFKPKTKFDNVVALDVIEHVGDPEAFIDKCRSHLNPGGRIILMTPIIGPGIPWRDCDFHPEHLQLFHIDHINEWLNPLHLELWYPGHMTIVCE